MTAALGIHTIAHQGAGLYGSLPAADLQVLALVAQPGTGRLAAEQELLWQLCAALQRLGHAPAVLDGSISERDDTPGLAHLLGGLHWCHGGLGNTLPVLPAAQGLNDLVLAARATGSAPLPWLVPALRSFDIVVIHAPATRLAAVLRGSGAIPMLVVPPHGKAALVAAYESLKQLLLNGGSLPFVVSAVDGSARGAAQAAAVQQSLRACVARHLGGRHLATATVRTAAAIDLQRLALQWLEAAAAVTDPAASAAPSALPSSAPLRAAEPAVARSH